MWLDGSTTELPGFRSPESGVCPAAGHGEDRSFGFERSYRMRGRVLTDI